MAVSCLPGECRFRIVMVVCNTGCLVSFAQGGIAGVPSSLSFVLMFHSYLLLVACRLPCSDDQFCSTSIIILSHINNIKICCYCCFFNNKEITIVRTEKSFLHHHHAIYNDNYNQIKQSSSIVLF